MFVRVYYVQCAQRPGDSDWVFVSADAPRFLRHAICQMSLWGGVDRCGQYYLAFEMQPGMISRVLTLLVAVGYTEVPSSLVATFLSEGRESHASY
jgi:hypothetical protein